MTNDYTVLSKPHREIAEQLLPALREEMTEEEFRVDLQADLRGAVIDAITRDLAANLDMEDWHGMGFEEPADFLDADAIADAIADQTRWYFKDDQIGKSWDVLSVILEHAEEHGLADAAD